MSRPLSDVLRMQPGTIKAAIFVARYDLREPRFYLESVSGGMLHLWVRSVRVRGQEQMAHVARAFVFEAPSLRMQLESPSIAAGSAMTIEFALANEASEPAEFRVWFGDRPILQRQANS